MKQPEGDEQQQHLKEQSTADTGGTKGGKVEPGAIIPVDNTMEKRGEGDRTDTEEMYRLNDNNHQ